MHDNCVMRLDVGAAAERDEFLETYFAKCQDKLGFTPNVLRAWAFSRTKLRAFIDNVDDLMLGESGLDKLEREIIAVAVSAVKLCRPRRRCQEQLWRSCTGSSHCTKLSRCGP